MTLRMPWRTVRLYGLTALTGFVLAWLIVAFFFLPQSSTRDQVKVPSLTGMSLEEARLALDSAGLRFSLGAERPSKDVPRNGVVAQAPAPGATLPRMGTVRLEVSAGPRQIRVPSVAGLTVEAARTILSDSGLGAGGVQEEASDAPRGEVLRTKPDAGRFVGEGAAVEVIVSAGPPDLVMPDVIGREGSDALALLRQLGLTRIRVDSAETGTATGGIVGTQFPAAGTAIRSSDRVVLRLILRQ